MLLHLQLIKTKTQRAPTVFCSDKILTELLTTIKLAGYRFITVTPLTHQRFLARDDCEGKALREIFGWNVPFSVGVLCPLLQRLMTDGELIQSCGELGRSKLRIASLGTDVFLHSGFPTTESDAVFFGPDTYRFARFIRHELEKHFYLFSNALTESNQRPLRILDVGCGTGAGGIAAVRALPRGRSYEMIMNDINPTALHLTRVNAHVAEIPVTLLSGNIFEVIEGEFDLIISNPPYMSDPLGRAYRDGGSRLGLDLSIRIVATAFEHLASGGKLILYTGVAMVGQSDPFLSVIKPLLSSANCAWSYEEIDPDVFSEELEQPTYLAAHRIAAVGLTVTKF